VDHTGVFSKSDSDSDSESESLMDRHKKEMETQKEYLIAKSNQLLTDNMAAYEDYIASLILIHTDIDLWDLIANTKSVCNFTTLK